ncbi:MAG: hypothetical protein GKR89_15040 [Candidatus Latescibacteria bacterium]|nr:hypothetical protein [Candidatus Latescibacterota bacterium]
MEKKIPAFISQYLESRQTGILDAGERTQRLSLKGFWIGTFFSFFLAVAAPYTNMIQRSTLMATDFSTPGAIFLFLLLIGLLNPVFKLSARHLGWAVLLALLVAIPWLANFWPLDRIDIHSPGFLFATFLLLSTLANVPMVARGNSLALNRSDLILVYVMLVIVSAVCTMGLSEQILPMISAVFYYATPANKWAEKLFPNLPQRTIMVDDGNRNTAFYEGATQAGQAIPYHAWVEPLLWWGLFLLALYVTMVSVAVVLRRQWMERERLAYPIAQAGLAMIRGEENNRLVNRFFKQRAMWIGAAIPMVLLSLIALHRYFPAVAPVRLNWWMPFVGSQRLQLSIHFAVLGFSYLINANIAAGVWIFHLLAKVEKSFLVVTGMRSVQKTTFGASDFPLMAYQGVGALIALVLVGMWIGREHLKNVFLKAVGRGAHINDDDEIMSYRAAFFGSVGGIGVMILWFWTMGMPGWVAALFVVTSILVFIGMTRIVAEAGLPVVRSPLAVPEFIGQGLGSALVGTPGMFNLSLSFIFAADTRVFVMATLTNALKMIEEMPPRNRRLIFWSVVLALFVGTLGSFWMIFHMAYRHGAINLHSWFFKSHPAVAYGLTLRNFEPAEIYWPGMAFFTGGGLVMALLMFLRQRFPWWPIHPIGFPVGGNAQFMNPLWFNVFLAWFIKKIILRYGGPALFERSQAFFLGLIAGQFFTTGFWLVVDYFTGRVGNSLPQW